MDRITKKLIELASRASTVNVYYSKVSEEDVIEVLGSEKPIWRGRPKKWLSSMLWMANYSPARYNAFHMQRAGLYYTTPAVLGIHRTNYHLTPVGFMLLDHLAAKNSKFEPFVKAYVSRETRDEAIDKCSDFLLGIVPPDYQKRIKKNEEVAAKYQAALLKQYQSQYAQGIAGTAVSPITWVGTSVTPQAYPYSTASGGAIGAPSSGISTATTPASSMLGAFNVVRKWI